MVYVIAHFGGFACALDWACQYFDLLHTDANLALSCFRLLANFQEELELLGTVTARLCRCLCHAPAVGSHERSHQVRHFCVPPAYEAVVFESRPSYFFG